MIVQPSNQSSQLLTVEEMAGELNVSTKTIYYWVGRFEIPFLKIGRHLRFQRDVVFQFFQDRTSELTGSCVPCLGSNRLVEPMTSKGRIFSQSSLKIRSGNSAET